MSKPKRGKTGPSQRQLRVGELVRHALSEVLAREMPSDPDLDGKSISITEVMMTPDLKIATCYVSLLGAQGNSPAVQTVIKRLAAHEKYLRGRATPMLAQMKSMPGFRFREDTSFDNFSRIDALLRSAEVSRDLKD